MCFTSSASFAMAGLLIGGGAFCARKSIQSGHAYLPMAIMPVAVGVQQFAEGMVWMGAENGDGALMNRAALAYMLFVWVFWPCWTAFMTAILEPPDTGKKPILLALSVMGLSFGLLLYLPYLWHPDWLRPEIVRHSMNYQTVLIPDQIMPRWLTSLVYLFFVGVPPLLSSHFAVRRFGLSLIVFVPLTYFFFVYAYISALCFFAALMTLDLIYIIAGNKCTAERALRALKGKKA